MVKAALRAEYSLNLAERNFSKTYYAGESFPSQTFTFGPNVMSTYVGVEPRFIPDTTWFRLPLIKVGLRCLRMTFRTLNEPLFDLTDHPQEVKKGLYLSTSCNLEKEARELLEKAPKRNLYKTLSISL